MHDMTNWWEDEQIVEIANATSLSFAFITGLVAAIAEPPHMEVPTPINILKCSLILNSFINT